MNNVRTKHASIPQSSEKLPTTPKTTVAKIGIVLYVAAENGPEDQKIKHIGVPVHGKGWDAPFLLYRYVAHMFKAHSIINQMNSTHLSRRFEWWPCNAVLSVNSCLEIV